MLLKGADKPSWQMRRQRQERHKFKYIYVIYQIVTCFGPVADGNLMLISASPAGRTPKSVSGNSSGRRKARLR
jgi:hypothetical protein